MKKTRSLTLLLASLILLSACSVRSDAADMYKQEAPVEVKIKLPESISIDQEIAVQASLKQGGEDLENADFVHFEIWKQDGSIRYPMTETQDKGKGLYQLTVTFESDGLYIMEVHAGNNGSVVSPQQQFVVGELSDSEMELLKQGTKREPGTQSHHH